MTTLPATEANIAVAAERLARGLLVAMPTETVYGLGADALNEEACKRIFTVKGRPPTDPLIVHIVDPALMDELWNIDAASKRVATCLAAALWPGPLTLVATASAVVPSAVTGGSGFVGLRSPAHPVARQLIEVSKKSIAAPSANTFGHVSPTTAAHVAADLAPRDDTLTILDGGSCAVGIESTVVKIVSATHLEVLRRGAVSAAQVVAALRAAGVENVDVTIRDTRAKYATEAVAMDGPGQLLTHYSPNVPSFLVTPSSLPTTTTTMNGNASGAVAASAGDWTVEVNGEVVHAKDVVVLDFHGDLASLTSRCLAFRSLSSSGDAVEACHEVFDALRWTETVVGAKAVVFPLVSEFRVPASPTAAALLDAVEDRLFRAASGRIVRLNPAE
jgi:L-threonylcarbamoyladenylate synthase